MKNSCRYTEMAHVFKYGTTSQQNFTFGGLNNFITQAKAAQKALETMDFQAAAFTDLQTGLNTYLTSYASLKAVFDQVYFSPTNNQFTPIRDPLEVAAGAVERSDPGLRQRPQKGGFCVQQPRPVPFAPYL